MRTPFKPSQEWREHTAGTWNTAHTHTHTPLFLPLNPLTTPPSLTSPTISPAIIAWLWLRLLAVLHHSISPSFHNPCAVSMTGCRATVIRAGWYRQRTLCPLMLMFPTPGQIFLAHLGWEGTGINMATLAGCLRGSIRACSRSRASGGPSSSSSSSSSSCSCSSTSQLLDWLFWLPC